MNYKANMQNSILENIREEYFNKLEKDCVDFIEYEFNGNNEEGWVRDEYLDVSVEEMAEYIWGDSWQANWAIMNAKGI